tara:strand:- start:319 stop:453 length:135 start_codon:yes stop_codon:yes gene_type:complete
MVNCGAECRQGQSILRWKAEREFQAAFLPMKPVTGSIARNAEAP